MVEHSSLMLAEMQEMLYAQDQWALLLIFQGMDAAGKDARSNTLCPGEPAGCDVYAFKAPTNEELDHDFLCGSTSHAEPRKDRDLQPLLLRGSAGRTGAPQLLKAEKLPDEL